MTDLKSMFEAVRDEYDGTHEAPDRTLERALAASRQKTRSRKVVRWLVLPAAAVLTVSTAYAGATGKLGGVVDRVRDVMHLGSERDPGPTDPAAEVAKANPAAAKAKEAKAEAAPAEADAKAEPKAEAEAKAEAAAKAEAEAKVEAAANANAKTKVGAAAPAPPPVEAKPATEPAPPAPPTPVVAPPTPVVAAPAPSSTADPHAALYEEAHRLHFAARDPARALAAWDRYLAVAPSGRFAPEARYNRALTLVRLGRTAEAREALRPFLTGSYRREEATKLYDALGRDE